jgi:hypothetical protein
MKKCEKSYVLLIPCVYITGRNSITATTTDTFTSISSIAHCTMTCAGCIRDIELIEEALRSHLLFEVSILSQHFHVTSVRGPAIEHLRGPGRPTSMNTSITHHYISRYV